ncbi:MAG TPA: hypothetical protein DIW50_13340, partial [Prolixibacteraceae bacterium]|nr:hypothetical protein [Prolixibacteraceae bacterium]
MLIMGKTSKITGEKIGVEKMKTKQQIELKLAYNQLKESNERIRFILEATNTGTWEWNVQTGETVFNEIWARMIGYTLEELGPTTIETWSNLCHPGDLEIAKVQLNKYFNKETDQYETEFRLKHKNGHWVWVLDRGKVLVWTDDGKPLWMLGTHQNITERKLAEEAIKLDEARMESLLKINQYPAENIQKLLDFALEEAISLTGSKIGYIYFYNEEKKEFTLNTWSREVMQQCNVVEPQTIYELDKTGIWGEAVRQRKPIVVNDFTVPDPLKKGTPQGHAPLHKFLTIPVFSEKHIVAVIGVANKPDNYNDSDIRQLNLMMDAVWKIVQRKQTEEALKESETKYRTLFTQMNEGFALHKVIYDTAHHAVDYKILDINPVFEKQVGISAEKANGALATELYGVSSAPYLDIYARVAETGEHQFFQTYFPPLDRSFEISVFSPKQGFFATVFSDITERKQAEEALKKSEEMWRSLVKTIPDYIALYDNKGQYIFLNHFAEGFSLKDIEGKHYTDFLADESKIIYERAFEEAEQTRTTQYIEYSAYGDNHTLKNYESNIVPIFEGENLVNMLVIARDITQRKQADEELRETKDYLENLFNYANAPIIVWDSSFRITQFNKAFERISGRSASEVIGKEVDILFPSVTKDKSLGYIKQTSTGDRWEVIEIEIEQLDGTIHTLLWNSAAIYSSDGKTLIATIAQGQDITERKKALDALKESEVRLRELNATKDKFFSIISHDLRNPVSSVLDLTRLMDESMDDFSHDELHSLVRSLHKTTQSAYNLLENLLEWSRLQQGVILFNPQPIILQKEFWTFDESTLEMARKKSIGLDFDFPEDLKITADRNMLHSI